MYRYVSIIALFALILISGCVQEGIATGLSESQAKAIAQNSSGCMEVGGLSGDSFYNNISKTWWFDLDTVKPGCNPACVVYEDNLSAKVNWRCTGLIPPGNKTQCSKPCHIYIGQVNYMSDPPECISSDEPLFCTMEYRAGDACLGYISCALEDGDCKTTVDPEFYECISCFEGALANGTDQSSCESMYG